MGDNEIYRQKYTTSEQHGEIGYGCRPANVIFAADVRFHVQHFKSNGVANRIRRFDRKTKHKKLEQSEYTFCFVGTLSCDSRGERENETAIKKIGKSRRKKARIKSHKKKMMMRVKNRIIIKKRDEKRNWRWRWVYRRSGGVQEVNFTLSSLI